MSDQSGAEASSAAGWPVGRAAVPEAAALVELGHERAVGDLLVDPGAPEHEAAEPVDEIVRALQQALAVGLDVLGESALRLADPPVRGEGDEVAGLVGAEARARGIRPSCTAAAPTREEKSSALKRKRTPSTSTEKSRPLE